MAASQKIENSILHLPESAPWRSTVHQALAFAAESDPRCVSILADSISSSSIAAEREEIERSLKLFSDTLEQHPWKAWHAWSYVSHSSWRRPPVAPTASDIPKFRTHFQSLLGESKVLGNLPTLPQPLPRLVFREGAVTADEVKSASHGVGNHRACGTDMVAAEVFKCEQVHAAAAQIFTQWMLKRKIDSFQVILVPIFKKGSADDPSNYRGISLQSAAVKLFMRVLLKRLEPIDAFLLPAQAAFRAGRSTEQQVATLNHLIHVAKQRSNYRLQLCFLDFKKAFDSVDRQVLRNIMLLWGIPDEITATVLKYWEDVSLHLRIDGVTDDMALHTKAGVLQGDPLSPFLFLLAIDYILRFLKPGVTVGSTHVQALAYADDVVLLSETTEALQEQLQIFETVSHTIGLHLNVGPEKTARMVINGVPTERLHLLDGTTVPDVSSYKYLGVPLGEVGYRRIADFKHRIRKSWACIRRLDGIWSSNVSPQVKRKLFFALVVPHWTYCDIAWPRLRSSSIAMHRRCNVMLRHCLGPCAAEWHTEELYGGFSFLPVAAQRLRLQRLGHLVREHFEGRRYHMCVQTILWNPDNTHWKRHRGGQFTNIAESLCKEAQCRDGDDLICEMLHRQHWQNAVEKIAASTNLAMLEQLQKQRLRQRPRAS